MGSGDQDEMCNLFLRGYFDDPKMKPIFLHTIGDGIWAEEHDREASTYDGTYYPEGPLDS